MAVGSFHFEDFTFDAGERLLTRGDERLELGARYLDALTLLLRERGRLVTKDNFMREVWRGAPVTDEALTQCIRTLRRRLGDDAARPRFIETVPRYGYRFIAKTDAREAPDVAPAAVSDRDKPLPTAVLAGLGGAGAGIGGGLIYGLTAASASPAGGMGAVSALLVLLVINIAVGLAGGLGVGAGIAAGQSIKRGDWRWSTAGGLAGGLAIGAAGKLIGLDAFALLFGRSLAGMTGPLEGAMLGASLGLAAWIARRHALNLRASAAAGAAAGGLAGLFVPLAGGRLLGGSLNLLAGQFPEARFRLGAFGALLGENGFGRVSETVTATIEGGLFGAGVIAALALARTRPKG